jgi:hypothetical protein
MNDNICIPKSYFFIIFIIFSIFTYFHTLRMDRYKNNDSILKPTIIIKEIKSSSENNKEKSIIDVLSERDVDAVKNDFKPPERRLPRHNYPTRSVQKIINIPTRGYPDNYQNLGLLVRKNDERILKLFGRQKFPGSSQWEYYIVDSYNMQKVPLKLDGMKELSNNDVVAIPWLDTSKGKFEVKIFDYDAPRYNPHVY